MAAMASADDILVEAVLKQAQIEGIDVSKDTQAVVRMALQLQRRNFTDDDAPAGAAAGTATTDGCDGGGGGGGVHEPGMARTLTAQFLDLSAANAATSPRHRAALHVDTDEGAGDGGDGNGDAKAKGSGGGGGGACNVNSSAADAVVAAAADDGRGGRRARGNKPTFSAYHLAGTLSHLSSNAVRLLQATTRVLEWMSHNEDHLRPLVDLVVTSVYQLMNCQRVTLYFVDHSKKELWIALAKDSAVRGLRIPLGSGIAGHVALNGEAVISNDCYDSSNFNSSVDSDTGFRTQTMICAPIFSQHQSKVTAVLSAINKRSVPPAGADADCGTPKLPVIERSVSNGDGVIDSPMPPGTKVVPFTEDDLRMLETFCMQVGLALRKCTLQLALAKMVADHALERQQDDAMVMAQKSLFAEFAPPSPAHHHGRSASIQGLHSSVRAAQAASAEGAAGSDVTPSRSRSRTRSSPQPVPEGAGAGGTADGHGGAGGIDGGDASGGEDMGSSVDNESVVEVTEDMLVPDMVALGDGQQISITVLHDWQLDVLSFDDEALCFMGVRLLQEYIPADFPDEVDGKLVHFVQAVSKRYFPLPFHNFKHGFSVMHICYMMLRECPRAHQHLSYHKRFALLLAALCHDVGHPGVNNAFLVNVGDDIALRHNDDAVLERHHCMLTFEVLRDSECNLFAHTDLQTYQKIRRTIITAIMGTEMSKHMPMLNSLNGLVDLDAAFQDAAGQTLLIQSIVHCADLSGQALSFEVASKWGDLVLVEFAQQSQREEEAGVPLTPHMVGLEDRTGPTATRMQQGFVEHFILPLWEGMARVHPQLQHFVTNATANAERYRTRNKKAVTAAAAAAAAAPPAGNAAATRPALPK